MIHEVLKNINRIFKENDPDGLTEDEGSQAPHNFMKAIEENYDYLISKGIDLNEIYGCGLHGCVFAMSDPQWVAKITTDFAEVSYLTIAGMTEGFTLVPKVLDIEEISDEVYLIIREPVIPISSQLIYSWLKRELSKFDISAEDFYGNTGLSLIDGRVVLFDGRMTEI